MFFQTASAQGATVEQALSAVAQALTQETKANLGFLYTTDACADAYTRIVQVLTEKTGVSQWLGCVGMGICANDPRSAAGVYFNEPAIAVLLVDLPQGSFHVIRDEKELLLHNRETAMLQTGIVHLDPGSMELAEFITQMPSVLDATFLVGGLLASRGNPMQYANGLIETGLSGVVFDSKVTVVTGLSQGCNPIGPAHSIDVWNDNEITKLDQTPALDVFKNDIEQGMPRDVPLTQNTLFAGLQAAGYDRGDYLVRNIIEIDERKRSVSIGEYVTAGQRLLFCRRDPESATADLKRMLSELKHRVQQSKSQVRGGIYISCIGRGADLFGTENAEMNIVRDFFNVPIVGFYANGELSGQRLFTYTGVLCLFVQPSS